MFISGSRRKGCLLFLPFQFADFVFVPAFIAHSWNTVWPIDDFSAAVFCPFRRLVSDIDQQIVQYQVQRDASGRFPGGSSVIPCGQGKILKKSIQNTQNGLNFYVFRCKLKKLQWSLFAGDVAGLIYNRYISANSLENRPSKKVFCYRLRWNVPGEIVSSHLAGRSLAWW